MSELAVNGKSRLRPAIPILAIALAAIAGCASDPNATRLVIPYDCQRQINENKDPVVPYQSGLPSADCLRRIENQNADRRF